MIIVSGVCGLQLCDVWTILLSWHISAQCGVVLPEVDIKPLTSRSDVMHPDLS